MIHWLNYYSGFLHVCIKYTFRNPGCGALRGRPLLLTAVNAWRSMDPARRSPQPPIGSLSGPGAQLETRRGNMIELLGGDIYVTRLFQLVWLDPEGQSWFNFGSGSCFRVGVLSNYDIIIGVSGPCRILTGWGSCSGMVRSRRHRHCPVRGGPGPGPGGAGASYWARLCAPHRGALRNCLPSIPAGSPWWVPGGRRPVSTSGPSGSGASCCVPFGPFSQPYPCLFSQGNPLGFP